jgi:hypothetical protein
MPGPGAPPNAKIPAQPGGFGGAGAARGLYGGGLGGGGGAFGGMDLLGGGGGFGGAPGGMPQFPFMVPPPTPRPPIPT